MSNWALVVGIETFPSKRNNVGSLRGPALDALRFALWVSEQNVPAKQILLFVQKGPGWTGARAVEYDQALAEVTAKGIQVVESATKAQIWEAWGQTILSGDDDPGDLYIYWSGHGVTFSTTGDEAVLCGSSDPVSEWSEYIYLSELTRGLRTNKYARFPNQRLIIDACATPVSFEDVDSEGGRVAQSFTPKWEPEQVTITAVPRGQDAVAEEGGSLFTRVLLGQLVAKGKWPEDIIEFFRELEAAILPEVSGAKMAPRLIRYRSPGGGGDEIRISERTQLTRIMPIFQALNACDVAPSKYRFIYVRVTGHQSPEDRRSSATALSAMLEELDGKTSLTFGGYSREMIEFLLRITRLFPENSKPLQVWLESIPAAGRKEIDDALDGESSAWNLAIDLRESLSDELYPIAISTFLWASGNKQLVGQWPDPAVAPYLTPGTNLAGLKCALSRIILKARARALRVNVQLSVHIIADPPLFDQLYHDLPFVPDDAEDDRIMGEFCPFFLRSRARLIGEDAYPIEPWRAKSLALREQAGNGIQLHPATGTKEDRQPVANLDGLLVIREALAAMGSQPASKSEACRFLSYALKRGLPLISWRVASPPDGDWTAAEKSLAAILKSCNSVAEMPERLRQLREKKTEDWPRTIAFMWDEADAVPYPRKFEELDQE